ncbi:MAG: T9SS type A sorting domain-containing protein [Ignavibacteria bacterium]|nr:T9SS type A sorting domain-containing protein [Ignavibacteria bacterium]
MKRLILFELIVLFLATTFESDSPPGWFQQTLPRTDITVQDIYFIDSLMGFCVVRKNTNDSAFIYKTSDGGNNWATAFGENIYLTTIQFVDNNTGYSVGSGGGGGIVKKTINGGVNWYTSALVSGFPLSDVFFVNENTGWTCSEDIFGAGLLKTTNGGVNWQSQLGASFKPTKLFFLNEDTGWVNCNGVVNSGTYRTTDAGVSWVKMDNIGFGDIYFFNKLVGIRASGEFYKTTNGGINWFVTSSLAGGKLSFVTDSIGWAGNNFNNITKTTTGGNTWFYQSSPIFNNLSISAVETLKAWAGGNGLVHTTDGGGPPVGIEPVGTEIPSEYKLFQNYPNPFNPVTNIGFRIAGFGLVTLKIFDITGKEITTLINEELRAGEYKTDWNASGFSSGVYFYSLTVEGQIIDTKKMLMIK